MATFNRALLCLTFLTFTFQHSLLAQLDNAYSFRSPQGWSFGNSNMRIDTLEFEVFDKGDFAIVDMYASFSATDSRSNLQEEHQYEMVWYFNTHPNTSIFDMWLWVGDTVSVAQLGTVWQATQVYEDIVGRRRDPALLRQYDRNYYEIRVYPYLKDEVRKIKISYAVPINDYGFSDAITIPLSNMSRFDFPSEVNVKMMETSAGSSYSIFRDGESRSLENEISIESGNPVNKGDIVISKVNPNKSSPKITVFTDESDSYFSLGYSLSDIALESSEPKKVIFSIDMLHAGNAVDRPSFVTNLIGSMKNTFSETDSMIVWYDNFNPVKISPTWLPIDSVSLSILKDSLLNNKNTVANGGLQLMNSVFNDAKQIEGSEDIMFISNVHQNVTVEIFNNFIEQLKANERLSGVRVNVLDLQTNPEWYWDTGVSFRGYSYLYTYLTRATGGFYLNAYDNRNDWIAIAKQADPADNEVMSTNLLSTAMAGISKHIDEFEFRIEPTNGFVTSSFLYSAGSPNYVKNRNQMVGKFIGTSPIELVLNYVNDGAYKQEKITIEENEVQESDSTLSRFWAANYINNSQWDGYFDTERIRDIIIHSATFRVLSRYTAMLALEPSDDRDITVDPYEFTDDGSGGNGGIPTSSEGIEEEIPSKIQIEAYPNPFNGQVRINVTLPEAWTSSNTIEIYNVLGQRVYSFNTQQFNGSRTFTLSWDGTGGNGLKVSTGVYVIRLNYNGNVESHKITFLK